MLLTFLQDPNYYVLFISCQLKAFLENPEAFAALAPAVSSDDAAVAAAEDTKEEKKEEEEEEESDDDMGFGLFDQAIGNQQLINKSL